MLQRDPELAQVRAWPLPPRLSEARRRVSWLVLGVAVFVLLAIAVAGITFAALRDGSRAPLVAARQQPLRVTLVNEGDPPPSTSASSVLSGPILGLRHASRDLGVTTSVVWNGHFARAAATSDLMILGATPYQRDFEAIARLARRYPKKRFVVSEAITTGPPFQGLRNVAGIAFDDRQLGYLSGYLAGLMVRPHEAVSAVGGKRVASVLDLIAGYRAGAKRAQPTVRVIVDYSRSFAPIDQNLCESVANDQIDGGAKVVFDVAGACGFGAMQAARIRGVWGLGVDSDLSYLGPEILASAVKRFDRATEAVIALDVEGKLPRGGNVTLNLANDAVGLVGISDQVPESARRKLEAVAAKFRAQDQARP
jgi:basic membrane protein A